VEQGKNKKLFNSEKDSAEAGSIFLFETQALAEQDPLSIFHKIKELGKPCFFFQKNQEIESGLRVSQTVLGFDEFERMTCKAGSVKIEGEGNPCEISGNPFEVISQRLQKYQVVNQPGLPDFQMGAFGYFTYESVRYNEPILNQALGSFQILKQNNNFVDAEFILFKKIIIFDYLEKKIFLMSGFSDDDQSGLEFLKDLLKNSKSLLDIHVPQGELPPETFKSSLGKGRFIEGVKKLKEHITAGDIFQAVLSERFEADLSIKPFDVFRRLLQTSISVYEFYFFTGKRVFLGASPELLLQVSGEDLETHPIAGTRPRGVNPQEEKKLEKQLLASVKENAEHLMLVDLARNDLGRISKPGTVRVPEQVKIKKFPSVMHLVSRVTGKKKQDISALEALASCFPAGTLSGAPKVRAMQLLSEIENEPRGFYGGAVALASLTGDLDSCIAIRSMEIENGHSTIQAGAGIVSDSNPEKEYQEILHKTKTLRRILFSGVKSS